MVLCPIRVLVAKNPLNSLRKSVFLSVALFSPFVSLPAAIITGQSRMLRPCFCPERRSSPLRTAKAVHFPCQLCWGCESRPLSKEGVSPFRVRWLLFDSLRSNKCKKQRRPLHCEKPSFFRLCIVEESSENKRARENPCSLK